MRRLIGGLAAAAVLAGAAAVPADGFTPDERRHVAQLVRNAMHDLRQPGVNVGIWIPGRGSYVRSFGVADRRTGRKMRIRDHVRIASITKTFTATAILQLVDRGRIGLDDTLERYVPGIPNGGQITVRQLLGMTSGIYDFTADRRFGREFTERPRMSFDLRDVVDIVARHEPAFSPGAQVQYCDTNYVLLGAILEEVTGQPAGEVIERQIVEPLRLNRTSYPATPAMPRPYARGYFAGDDGRGRLRDYTAVNPAVPGTAGAMISTVRDLRRWVRALAAGRLLSAGTQAQRVQFGTIPNPGGPAIGYGLGIFRFADFVGHNGAILGYSTIAMVEPRSRATIVIASNQASNSSTATTTMFFELAEYLMPQAVAPS